VSAPTVVPPPPTETVRDRPLVRLRDTVQGVALQTRLGVLGAVALVALLAGLVVIAVKPFADADESAHADYGLTLFTQWRLPTLFDHVHPVFPYQDAKPQHVANHPPLYYLLTGPVLSLGVRTGHLVSAYLLARGVSVLAAMAIVVLIAAFVHALSRGRRPGLTVGAAVLTASYAPFVVVSGVLQNDALAVAFSCAVLWQVVLVVQRGLHPRLIALLAVTALLGTATRADNASLVLIACLAAVAAGPLHAGTRSDRWRSGLIRGLVAGFAIGLTSLVGIGWFYVRNQVLYGNALGYGVLEGAFGKAAPPHSLWLLRNPRLLLEQLGLPQIAELRSWTGVLAALPAVAVAAGLLVILLRAVKARLRPGAPVAAGFDKERTVRRILVALFAVHTLITVVMVIRHVDAGGGIHPRYLFPLLPLAATAAAAALLALPGGRRGLYLAAAVAAGIVTSFQTIGLSSWRWEATVGGSALEGIRRGLAHLGIPLPTAVLGVTLSLVALAAALAVGCLWALGARRSSSASRGPRATQPVLQALQEQPRPTLA
jgi:hypothetical protein